MPFLLSLLVVLVARAPPAAGAAADTITVPPGGGGGGRSTTSTGGAVPPSVLLFTDPRLADLTTFHSWTVTPGPVVKETTNPLLVEDQLWDVRWDNTYITARFDHASQTFRLWYNGFASCADYVQDADEPGPRDACGHPTWHTTFGARGLIPWPNSPGRPMSALMYAESQDGINYTKSIGGPGTIAYPWNGTNNTAVSPTNILMMGEAASGTGVFFDAHETNASRRYKALGSFWNYLHCGKRPVHAVHGSEGICVYLFACIART